MAGRDVGAAGTARPLDDDTHNPAAQASAARLLTQLRGAYAGIQTHWLVDAESGVTTDTPLEFVQGAQATLIAYLKSHQSGHVPTLSAEERGNPCITATICVVDLILARLDTRALGKNREAILSQLIDVAQTCPGMQWDSNHQSWSRNTVYIYPEGVETKHTVIASPADTLNLVSAAMLDAARQVPLQEGETQESRQQHLVDSMIDLLFKWHQILTAQGGAQVCSTGKQHGLLYLLRGTYIGPNGRPIELLDDLTSYLHRMMAEWVKRQLQDWDVTARDAFFRSFFVDHDSSPVIALLRKGGSTPLDADISEEEIGYQELFEYLIQAIKDQGISLSATKHLIKLAIQSVGDLSVSHLVDDPYSLLGLEVDKIRPFHLAGVDVLLRAAFERFNAMLTNLQGRRRSRASTVSTSLDEEQIALQNEMQTILTVYGYLMTLQTCDSLSLFLSAGLSEALEVVRVPWLAQLANLGVDSLRSGSFHAAKAAYLAVWDQVKQEAKEAQFTNLFVGLDARPFVVPESLPDLTDAMLEEWTRRFEIEAEANGGEAYCTPYEVGRVVWHALKFDPDAWSDRYKRALVLVLDWFERPSELDSIAERAFKASYPRCLVMNLRWIQRLWPLLGETDLKGLIIEIFRRENFSFAMDKDCFVKLLSPRSNYSHLGARLIQALLRNGHTVALARLIQNDLQLLFLLYLNREQLPDAARADLLAALRDHWARLIQNGYHLHSFLCLNRDYLPDAMRADILATFQGQWARLIQNISQLSVLLCRNREQLPDAARAAILDAFQSQRARLIQDGYQLRNLLILNREELLDAERADILAAFRGQWATLIQNLHQLHALLRLNRDHLPDAVRAAILEAFRDQWTRLIQDGDQLSALFSLSSEQLPDAERAVISKALQSQSRIFATVFAPAAAAPHDPGGHFEL